VVTRSESAQLISLANRFRQASVPMTARQSARAPEQLLAAWEKPDAVPLRDEGRQDTRHP
jgi:hypothetical protein